VFANRFGRWTPHITARWQNLMSEQHVSADRTVFVSRRTVVGAGLRRSLRGRQTAVSIVAAEDAPSEHFSNRPAANDSGHKNELCHHEGREAHHVQDNSVGIGTCHLGTLFQTVAIAVRFVFGWKAPGADFTAEGSVRHRELRRAPDRFGLLFEGLFAAIAATTIHQMSHDQ